MKAEDKNRYMQELRNIQEHLSKETLLQNPDNVLQIAKINRITAIFKDFSSDIGIELERRLSEFQKWCRIGTRPQHSKNLLNDLLQFIGRKTEEMDVYQIQPVKNEGHGNKNITIINSTFSGNRGAGIFDGGENTKIIDNKFIDQKVGVIGMGKNAKIKRNIFENAPTETGSFLSKSFRFFFVPLAVAVIAGLILLYVFGVGG